MLDNRVLIIFCKPENSWVLKPVCIHRIQKRARGQSLHFLNGDVGGGEVRGGRSAEPDFELTACVHALALLLISCVTLGRSLTLSVLQFFQQ